MWQESTRRAVHCSSMTRRSPKSRQAPGARATSSAPARTYQTEVLGDPDGSTMTALAVPFDPAEVFGKARAPVVVQVGKHEFRSTICIMDGERFIPLRKSNRDAAGVVAGERVSVTLTLDEKPRVVTAPKDLAAALRKAGLSEAWKKLSFTHQREHVESIEGAKKPDTRERRIKACVKMVAARSRR